MKIKAEDLYIFYQESLLGFRETRRTNGNPQGSWICFGLGKGGAAGVAVLM